MSREALVAAYSKCDTATRLLAPTHSVKVDQGILPVVDYLHINLTDFLEVRGVNNAKSLRTRHGGNQKGELIVLSVLTRVDDTIIQNTVKCQSTHKAEVQCFTVNGKFLFISVTFTMLVARICLFN